MMGGSLGVTLSYIDNSKEMVEICKILLTSGTYSVLLFGILSIFTIITKSRVAIFLGSFIASIFLGLISLFVYRTYYEAVLGLLIGCCYIIFDTQIIIFNVESGKKDPFTDALNLFTDLFKVFMEIVKILSDKKEKKKKRD